MLLTNLLKVFTQFTQIMVQKYQILKNITQQKFVNLTHSRNRTNSVMKQELLKTSIIAEHIWKDFSKCVKESLYPKWVQSSTYLGILLCLLLGAVNDVHAQSDLSLSMTADNVNSTIGSTVTFTLKVKNAGPQAATNIVIKDAVPVGATFVSAAPSAAYAAGEWTIASLANGDSTTLTLTTTINSDGVIFSDAEIKSVDQTDPDSTPNDANVSQDDWTSACTTVPIFYCPGSTINIDVEAPAGYLTYKWFKDGVEVAQTALYTITDFGSYYYSMTTSTGCNAQLCCPIKVQAKFTCLSLGNLVFEDLNNNGTRDAGEPSIAGVTVQLYLLKGATKDITVDSLAGTATTTADTTSNYLFSGLNAGKYYVKLSNIPASYVSSTGDGKYDADGAGAYEPSTVSDINNADNGTAMGATMIMSGIVDLAIGTEPTNDGDTDANTNLTVDFGLYKPATFDLALDKKLSASQSGTVTPGADVKFTINVYNQGSVAAKDVKITDYIPSGFTFNAAKNTTWTAAGANAETTLAGPIAAGASTSVDIILTVNAGVSGSLKNEAEIADADDTDPATSKPADKDSTPDADKANDGTAKDDVVNEDRKSDPTKDEDDSDFASVTVTPNPTLSLGNLVFEDLNNNGKRDAGEPSIAGVTVQLYLLKGTASNFNVISTEVEVPAANVANFDCNVATPLLYAQFASANVIPTGT